MKATVHDPRYILRLDELPKVVEADGVVWPVYMTARETARLFHIHVQTLWGWIDRHGLPAIRVGAHLRPRYYISVADLNDWLIAHSVSHAAYVARFAKDDPDTDSVDVLGELYAEPDTDDEPGDHDEDDEVEPE